MIIRATDTETTGLEPTDEIVEIAAVDVAQGCLPSWAFNELVRPVKPIPPEASAVHHITDEDVRNAPVWADIGPRLFRESNLAGVVAFAFHKASYDLQYIPREFLHGLPVICTWKCALRRWPDAPSHSNQALRYYLGLDVGPEAMPPHRALPDVHVTGAIVVELLKDCSLEQLIEWTNEPPLMPRCPIGEHRGKPWPEVDQGFLEWCLTKKDMDTEIIFNVRRELQRRVDARAAAVEEARTKYADEAVALTKQAITVEDLRSWFAWDSEQRSSLGIYPNTIHYKRIVDACEERKKQLPPPIPKPEAPNAQA